MINIALSYTFYLFGSYLQRTPSDQSYLTPLTPLAPYSLSAAPSERTRTKLEPYKAWLAASPTLCFVNGDMFMITYQQEIRSGWASLLAGKIESLEACAGYLPSMPLSFASKLA